MAYIGNQLQTAQPNYQIIDDISGSFNGTTTTFALQVGGVTPTPFPVSAQHCIISVGGVVQEPDPTGTNGFLLSGSNIVFSSAPSSGESFFGTVLAGADYINVGASFPDGSVANPSITFDQDLDTGLYRSASGTTSISANGTNVADFGPSQLDVSGVIRRTNSGSSGYYFRGYRNSTTSAFYIYDDGTDIQLTNQQVGAIKFHTQNTERARIDSSGRLLVGTSSSRSNNLGSNFQFQIEGTGGDTAGAALVRNSDNGGAPYFVLGKTRATSIGGSTAVSSGDGLGEFHFTGSDGTNLISAAIISAAVDGTPGANDMPGRIVLSTTADGASTPTERMRIAKNGAVMFLKTTTANLFVDGFEVNNTGTGAQLLLTNSGNGTVAMYISCRYGAGYQYPMQFYYGTSHVGSIRISGTVTDYLTTSDYRLKENVVEITDGIDRIKQLRPSRFNFIANPSVTVDGFIAHEAQTVVPEAISGEHNGVQTWKETDELPEGVSVGDPKLDEDGNTIPEYQGIDQSKLVPLLTAALQEAIAKIETLEASNAALEARLTALEGGAS